MEVARGGDLESILAELSKAKDSPRALQFLEIPPYLQQLFWGISNGFTRQPINYLNLVDQLFSREAGFDRIVLVTLNYDVVLDSILSPDYIEPLNSMRSYISGRCMLVKLHGSANWARPIRRDPAGADYLAAVRSLNLKTDIGDEISISAGPENMAGWNSTEYPALSVPLGTYTPSCPPEHVQALKEALSSCHHVLAIGCSGKDNDLLELLRNHLPRFAMTFYLVGGDDLDDVRERFRQVHAFELSVEKQFFSAGFTAFLLDGGLNSFISDSRKFD
jgi:hypothetical protein